MKRLLALAAIMASVSGAWADTASFSGDVEDTCTLDIGPGVLKPNVLHNTLSTATAGGQPSQITATTTSNAFTVSVTPPSDFTSKPGLYTSTTTFTSMMEISGATSASGTTSQALNSGGHDIQLSLRADADTGVFPTGTYTAEVTITCE